MGLPIIIEAYQNHPQESDIVESFSTLLLEITEYDDAVAELQAPSLKLKEILSNVLKEFKNEEDIVSNAETVLSKLGVNVKASQSLSVNRSSRKR